MLVYIYYTYMYTHTHTHTEPFIVKIMQKFTVLEMLYGCEKK